MTTQALLTTERLAFHAFTANDLDVLIDLHGDGEVMRHLSLDGRPWSMDVVRGKLKRFIDEHAALGFSRWRVHTHADGAVIGRAGFSVVPQTGELELGFIFRRQAWGKGYATECACGLIAWLFDRKPKVDHVVAFTRPDNLASRRVLEKIGMIGTGSRLVDGVEHEFYRLDRS